MSHSHGLCQIIGNISVTVSAAARHWRSHPRKPGPLLRPSTRYSGCIPAAFTTAAICFSPCLIISVTRSDVV